MIMMMMTIITTGGGGELTPPASRGALVSRTKDASAAGTRATAARTHRPFVAFLRKRRGARPFPRSFFFPRADQRSARRYSGSDRDRVRKRSVDVVGHRPPPRFPILSLVFSGRKYTGSYTGSYIGPIRFL